ncbi:MAG: zinc ribbon domain-containing protein [Nostoc sp.]|uniref:zinc ribbon domain-containing protein n=1 Tax=Nostoc sp. TaxID=1180 RepID=UPI002FEF878A
MAQSTRHRRSQFCFLCGTALGNSCTQCNEPITSLKFRFCPYCGFPCPKAYPFMTKPRQELRKQLQTS